MKDRKIIALIKSNGATDTAINFDQQMQAIQSPAIFSKSINIKHLHIYRCGTGLKTGIAQLVECLTKKPDAIQMWV